MTVNTTKAAIELQAINEFIGYLEEMTDAKHDMEEIEKLYDENITISFLGKSINVRFSAVPYNELIDFLKTVASEY